MEYEFYHDFLDEQEDVDVYSRELEFFGEDDFDTDIWARLDVDAGDRKYRLTFQEDSSPNGGRSNYRFKVSKKEPLNIDDGWTNWRRVSDSSYENYQAVSFEKEVMDELSKIMPVEFQNLQDTL